MSSSFPPPPSNAKKSGSVLAISQSTYDEAVLENEEIFESSPAEAVEETISQFKSQNISLLGLITTHPNSLEGKKSRDELNSYVRCLEDLDGFILQDGSIDVENEERLVACLTAMRSEVNLDYIPLIIQSNGIYTLLSLLGCKLKTVTDESIETLFVLLRVAPLALRKEMQGVISRGINLIYALLRNEQNDGTDTVLKLCSAICRGNERNKVTIMRQEDGGKILMDRLRRYPVEVCNLMTILCRYDDKEAETSSAHDHALQLVNLGLLPILYKLSVDSFDNDNEELSVSSLTTLRTLSINDDIIQSLVALGLLRSILPKALLLSSTNPKMATCTLGLIRNICQNDQIKTTLCHNKITMPQIINVLHTFPKQPTLQEHGCAIVAAMALRVPSNARTLCLEYDAISHVLQAMKTLDTNVAVQRQGSLAIRNVVSRDNKMQGEGDLKVRVMELGAEELLRMAGRFQGSVDEAYAALRDLGCKANLIRVGEDGELKRTVDTFGQKKLNFRQVWDDTNEVEERMESISQAGCS